MDNKESTHDKNQKCIEYFVERHRANPTELDFLDLLTFRKILADGYSFAIDKELKLLMLVDASSVFIYMTELEDLYSLVKAYVITPDVVAIVDNGIANEQDSRFVNFCIESQLRSEHKIMVATIQSLRNKHPEWDLQITDIERLVI